jgi:hypothetical protein
MAKSPAGVSAPEVLPDLAKESEGAPQFARRTVDAFLDPQTRKSIGAVKRPVLVVAGFATEAVVLHPALSALESCPSTPAAAYRRARSMRRSTRSRQREA